MTEQKARFWVKVILRVGGLGMVGGVIGLVMPVSWMDATHQWLGMGELPRLPVVEYLARITSALYMLVGALMLLSSADLDRYRQIIAALAWGVMLASIAVFGMMFTRSSPIVTYLAIDVISASAMGLAIVALLRKIPARPGDED